MDGAISSIVSRIDLSIVGVTGNATTEDQKEYVDAGADQSVFHGYRIPNVRLAELKFFPVS